MDMINFDSLFWLYKFKQELKNNYKKMFYPKDNDFNRLWQMYVDNYIKIKELGLDIPDEEDYPTYFDYILNNYDYKQKYEEFCRKMEKTIYIIDEFLRRKEKLI